MYDEFIPFLKYTGTSQCGYNEYQCLYTALYCVDENHVCDGSIDCPYGDDEEDCPAGKYLM